MKGENRQKPEGKLFNLVNFIIRIALIIGVLYAFRVAAYKKEIKAYKELLESQLREKSDINDTTLFRDLNAKASDLEGKTQWDKLNMGLDPADGSDSDRDGLTDKEEIEVYGSDPLKASTAGDLYLDGYKVGKHMDLHKKEKKFDGEIKFTGNKCDEITLEAVTADDQFAMVGSSDIMHHVRGYETVREYYVNDFGGKFSIDISAIPELNGVKTGDIRVYSTWMGSELTDKLKTKVKKNVITAECNTEYSGREYFIMVAKKTDESSLAGFALNLLNGSSINSMATILDTERKAVNGDGFVVVTPVLANAQAFKPKVYFVSSGDEETDTIVKERLCQGANRAVNIAWHTEGSSTTLFNAGGEKIKTKPEDVIEVDEIYLETLKEFWRSTSPDREMSGFDLYDKCYVSEEMNWFSACLKTWYFTYDDMAPYFIEAAEDEMKHFNAHYDALPFSNFGSPYMKDAGSGMCAGFALYTAMMYNNGTVPLSGSLSVDEVEHTWDISKHSENKTLTDPGLHDFHDYDWMKPDMLEHRLLDPGKVSESDKEFVEMLGCYFYEMNHPASDAGYKMTYGHVPAFITNELTPEYNVKNLDAVKDYLDAGKMAILFIADSTGVVYPENFDKEKDHIFYNGHAINVYDYKEMSDSWTVFYVYDCNYPALNRSWRHKINNELWVYTRNDDGKKTLIYEYNPFKGSYRDVDGYDISQDLITNANCDWYMFEFYDDNRVAIREGYEAPESIYDIYNVESDHRIPDAVIEQNTENSQ